MAPSERSGRDALIDVAAAVFPPVILFLVPFNDILFTNVEDLLYNTTLVRAFFIAGVATWAGGFFVVRRFQGRVVARLWLALPWTVLLLDVLGAAVERRSERLDVAVFIDTVVLLTVVIAAFRIPWGSIRAVAAAAGFALLVHGLIAHASFVGELPLDLVVGGTIAGSVPPTPGRDAPGNVYHILLDAYQSEAFSFSGADAARRFPGFTFFSRFNTNFPSTSSSEPALIEGRFPRPGMSIEEWPARALRTGFWSDLAAADVGLWLYPYNGSLCHERAVQCVTSADLERDAGATVTRDTTIDLWALRLLPGSVRRALSVESSGAADTENFSATSAARVLLGRGADESPQSGIRSLPRQYFNLKQFDRLLTDEAMRPARGQYVYYHALIPHHDYILNERCEPVPEPRYGIDEYWAFVGCANLMIDRFAERLRELGRRDDALIIVHADHGDPNFIAAPVEWMKGDASRVLDPGARRYQAVDTTYAEDYDAYLRLWSGDSAAWRSFAVEQFSSGLLLVKRPDASVYSEDTRPVQLLDIAPTVLAHFGREASSYPGLSIPVVPPDREMVFYAHAREFDGKFSRYRLTTDGWHFVEDVPVRP